MMLKFSNKISNLNFEQKLLFLATLAIPAIIFIGLFDLAIREIYSLISDYLFPLDPRINFSSCGIGIDPLPIPYAILCALTLFFSSISILRQKFISSLIFISATLSLIVLRATSIFYLFNQIFNEFSFERLANYLISDFIAFVVVSILFIWQISILWRIRVKNSQMNTALK